MKSFLQIYSLLLAASFAFQSSVLSVRGDERPNVLIIMADDLGYADVGFNGSKDVETPVLDRLATQGVIFENGYVTHPYCGPSRAGFITGRYQARFGMEINVTYSPYDLHSGLPLDQRTFGDRLQDLGYTTGIIGKWHLGASAPFHPNNRGFDYFYGFLSGGHDYFPSTINTHHDLLLPNGKPHYSANEGSYLPLIRNTKDAEFDEYLTYALSKDAARFVKKTEDPFCLFLAYNAPHGPLEAPKDLLEKYSHIDTWQRRAYLAMIDAMDQGIGMVVDALKESDKFDNTLIFFLSDNGGVQSKPGYENETWADNGPLRNGKGSMREGGSHVPFIAYWSDGIPSGEKYLYPVSSLDIAATAIALAGGNVDDDTLDGVNLVPYVNGEKSGPPHDALFWRIRDGSAWCIRTPTAKYLLEGHGATEPELYDMVNDPYESNNIIDERPDQRQQLAAMWNEWNAKNSANILLQSGQYQQKRLQMYKELFEELNRSAEQRAPVTIE
ncbi:sulfatase family protein [Rubellicoccus peritrichatus]|uniref:Sulfatase-like hydrolase/transferase n=1 Tax=Rubellicoccus peritrichatus TaxID=3080537 RepID=A0AAQ3LDS3_9BACT|nr:sulfatase-like hydrolase/transferase [Puniceicoccus sp. CR14]WOO43631.1 sulfatase-like hydrolase/transferase [Puniceicoccus sp. CR14]